MIYNAEQLRSYSPFYFQWLVGSALLWPDCFLFRKIADGNFHHRQLTYFFFSFSFMIRL